MSSDDVKEILNRLERITARLEGVESRLGGAPACAGKSAAAPAGPAADAAVPRFVEEFDSFISDVVGPYLTASNTLGGGVATQAAAVKRAFDAQRDFLVVVGRSKKPADVKPLLTATYAAIAEAIAVKEKAKPRDTDVFHLTAVAEGIPALYWVETALPKPHVQSMAEAADFYLNKVLKENKEKPDGANHVAWAKSFKAIFPALGDYCKAHHTTGPSWNPSGGDASAAGAAPRAAAAPPAAGGPPPPPPMPKGLLIDRDAPSSGAPKGAISSQALFAELSKGEAVTAGLKKVDKSQMTHKNPALRATSVVPAVEPRAAPAAAPKGEVARGPPKKELKGNKWSVENFVGDQAVVLEGAQRNHSVYIYNCESSVIQIKDKVNSIAIDKCKKVGVVFQDAVASCEAVNCNSIQLQVLGRVPSISIDKTSGCQVYLSAECLDVEIVSAKSDELNVSVPSAVADADPIETPIPEQFKSTIDKATRTLRNEIIVHKG